ncbi:hypothetical protein GWI33_009018, partial [Rhynchophorus ferrugineus]
MAQKKSVLITKNFEYFKTLRRPSLERQTTLYDDSIYYNDTGQTTFYTAPEVTQINYLTSSTTFNQNQSCDEYY